MSLKTNLRDYGLADPARPRGPPIWKIADPPQECPNCKAIVCEITVRYDDEIEPIPGTHLGPGKKDGIYLGCPACPWASPIMLRTQYRKSDRERKTKEENGSNK